MKKTLAAMILVTLMSAFIYNKSGYNQGFKKLYVLEGRWMMKTKKGFMGEEWVKINDDYLQGKGFYIRGVDTVITERVALKKTIEGIFYTSTVEDQNDQQPVSFTMTSSENNVFIFENPSHDFPKRIIYDLVSADSLHAYIDAGVGGKRQDFYYRKENK